MNSAQALLRFSRDRRGYEHFYLVEPDRHGRGRERILYWFRSPPGVRVGRVPFDDELKRRIAAQNPGVSFDWPRLMATPIPPPAAEIERWRERRQTERAEKAARAARQADLEPGEPQEAMEGDEATGEGTGGGRVSDQVTGQEAAEALVSQDSETRPLKKRRRRRRRGRGRHGQAAAPPGEQAPPASNPDSSND